jgi:hydrogenase maturation protease
VPEAVQLGQALDRLPERLIIDAVEAADVGHGTGPSPAVAATLPELLDAILADLATS